MSRALPKTSLAGKCCEGKERPSLDLAKGTHEDTISYGISRVASATKQRTRHWWRARLSSAGNNVTRTGGAKHSSKPGNPQKDEALQLARGTPRAQEIGRQNMLLRTKFGIPISGLVKEPQRVGRAFADGPPKRNVSRHFHEYLGAKLHIINALPNDGPIPSTRARQAPLSTLLDTPANKAAIINDAKRGERNLKRFGNGLKLSERSGLRQRIARPIYAERHIIADVDSCPS